MATCLACVLCVCLQYGVQVLDFIQLQVYIVISLRLGGQVNMTDLSEFKSKKRAGYGNILVWTIKMKKKRCALLICAAKISRGGVGKSATISEILTIRYFCRP